MHIIEQYSLSCGVKIDKPSIEDSFFPLKEEKYITFHSHSKFDSRNYSHLQEVINLIAHPLKNKGITIIQLGINQDPAILGVNDLRGKCSINQSAYLIKNSLLHFGVDSFLIHLASHYDTPMVALYSNMLKEQSGPYWGSKEKQIIIESPKDGKKPSYSPVENPKTINQIMPEDVAVKILDLLKIEHDINKVETLHIGNNFSNPCVEIVPDFVSNQEFFKGRAINLRMDLHFNQDAMLEWGRSRKLSIITDKEINPNYLHSIKDHIILFNLEISEDISDSYLKEVRKVVKNLRIFSKSKDNLAKLRARFIDWDINFVEKITKKDIDKFEKICDNCLYKSSKTFLASGKRYSCRSSWEHGIEFSGEAEKIIDEDSFWEDISYFRIFKQ